MGRSEREANDSTKIGHLLKFEQASLHPSLESSWKLASATSNLQAVNTSGSYLFFCSLRESLHAYTKDIIRKPIH